MFIADESNIINWLKYIKTNIFSGVTICATIVPDIKPTPPFEFPSDGSDGLRILQVSDNNKNNYPFIYHENNDEITTAEPSDDNKPTPPLEFPSDGHMVKIVQASDTKLPFVYNVTNDEININKSTTQLQVEMKKKTCDGVLKSISQPINVITTVSENYTNNYIENKFYNNRAEDSRIKSSVTFTLLVLMIMAVIVLVSSAVCLKMVVK